MDLIASVAAAAKPLEVLLATDQRDGSPTPSHAASKAVREMSPRKRSASLADPASAATTAAGPAEPADVASEPPRKRVCFAVEPSKPDDAPVAAATAATRMGPPAVLAPLPPNAAMDQYASLVNMLLASENFANLERLGGKEFRRLKAKAVFSRAVQHQEEIARESRGRVTKADRELIAAINVELADCNHTIARFNYACAHRSSGTCESIDKELQLRTQRALEIADAHIKRLGGGCFCVAGLAPRREAAGTAPRISPPARLRT